MSAELTIDKLYDKYTSEEQVKAANQAPTVRTGSYRFKVQKIELRTDDRQPGDKFDKDTTMTPGRESARINAALLDKQTGERKGSIFFDVSWEPFEMDDKNGVKRLDSASKLWGNLVKVFDGERNVAKLAHPTEGLIISYPFDGSVTEAFEMPDGSRKYYRGDTADAREAERKKLIAEGGQPAANYVQNLYKVKAEA